MAMAKGVPSPIRTATTTSRLTASAAVCVLTTVAEVMWRRGVDLYGYQDRAMKRSYDAAIEAAGTGQISKLLALPGVEAYPCVFRHYQESRYWPVLARLKPGFTLAISEHLPSLPAAAGTRNKGDLPASSD